MDNTYKLFRNPLVLIVGGFILVNIVSFGQAVVTSNIAPSSTVSTSTNLTVAIMNIMSVLLGTSGVLMIIFGIILGIQWLARRGRKAA